MKAILAGTQRQYYYWMRENNESPKTAYYAHDVFALRGRVFDEIVAVGTFWEREDRHEIYNEAQRRLRENRGEE